ncbi:EpsG family protein [Bacteroides cellulosilyticus]|jgi:hypothetical protein|uniref:EpsG family protein n=2 Tax=Bacteroides cellulosilyticus TaxID=246787 RepID=A0A412HZ68_9BACE|nr:EpsG family protein [Bacteroides cellulosilyticus]
MLKSFIVYGGLMLFMSLNAYSYARIYNNRRIKLFHPLIAISILFYVLFLGMRFNVGVDYYAYWSEYIMSKNYISYDNLVYEPLFAYFTWILSSNNIHYTVYFSLIAFMQLIFLYKSFAYNPKLLSFVLFFFFYSFYFIGWQNVLRQNIIVSIFLYIVVNERSITFLRYVILVLFCSLIHKSSFFLLPIYPLIRTNVFEIRSVFLNVFIVLLCIIVGLKIDIFSWITSSDLFLNLALFTDYNAYLSKDSLDLGMWRSVGVGFALKILAELIIIVYSGKMKSFYNNDRTFSVCYKLYFWGLCYFYLVPLSMMLQRPNLYLNIFSIVIYAYFTNYTLKQNLYKNLMLALSLVTFLGILGVLFVYQVFYPEGYLAEYHFFFE